MVTLREKRVMKQYNIISTSKVLRQIQLMGETITSMDMPLAGMPGLLQASQPGNTI